MSRISKLLEGFAYAAIVLAAALELLSPFLVPELGYDGFHALMWIGSFPAIMRHGIWYPHWLPYAYAGLGSSTFYFYPPLAFFIIAPIRLFFWGMPNFVVYHIAGLLMTIASLFTMRYLLRILHARETLAWLGALLYAFSPYHFDVLYVRSGPAEHLAFVWAPLVIAGIFLLLRERSPSRGFFLLSISWGLLLLSHVPAAVTIGIAALVFVLASISKLSWPRFGLITLASILGSALAAFYLLPVGHFSSFAQLKYLRVTHEGLQDPFVALADILHGNNFTVKGIAVTHYLALVIMTVVLVALWWRSRNSEFGDNHNRLIPTLAIVCLVALFFENAAISRPVWNLLRLTQVVQFSWRWNLLASLLAAVIFATVRNRSARSWINLAVIALALIAGIAAAADNFDLRVHPRDAQRTPFDPPEYVPIYANLNKDSVVAFALAHEDDPLTLDTAERALPSQLESWQPNDIRITLTAATPTAVVLHHWYWPSWVVEDSATGEIIPSVPRPDGRESFQISAGSHTLDYRLETTGSEKAGIAISLGALAAIFLLELILIKLPEPQEKEQRKITTGTVGINDYMKTIPTSSIP